MSMRHLLISAAAAGLLLFAVLVITSAETYYITPTASIPCPEKGVPCFTLSQYANKSNNYIQIGSDITLILLPGKHILDLEFEIRNVSTAHINLVNNYTAHSVTYIVCSQHARFVFWDIVALSMRGVVLIGCMNNEINSVQQFTMEDCSFQGQGRDGRGLELDLVTSANIVGSSFSSCTGNLELRILRGLAPRFFPSVAEVGGAITIKSSTVSISSSTFTNNIVNGLNNVGASGGAMYARSSNITIHTTAFNNNTATVTVYDEENAYGRGGQGGAVYAESSNITIHSTIFNNNTVTGTGKDASGGAVYMYADYGNIIIHNTTFNNNTVTATVTIRYYPSAEGGALAMIAKLDHNNNIMITIVNTTFNDNTATSIGNDASGGAVYTNFDYITIHNTTFKGNTATAYEGQGNNQHRGKGGAVHTSSSIITIHNATFNNNTATGEDASGGAVHADPSGTICIPINSTTFNKKGFICDWWASDLYCKE